MSKKIVFCGGGNMAEGILARLVEKQVTDKENITVIELREERCDYLSNTYGVHATPASQGAYAQADMVIVALLPQLIEKVIPSIAEEISKDAIVVSIAAGVSVATIENCLGGDRKVARVMPNTLGASGNGYSAVNYNYQCGEADRDFVAQVLNALGQSMLLDEDMFDTFSCFATAGPMWMYKLIEAMTDAGVYVGFSREDARNIVIKNMIGAAATIDATGEHPAARVDKMTSPGGVTIEALITLQEEGFSTAIANSVIAGVEKANSL